ncbi:hypothetical protein BH23GEM9_BH23GEM9_01340 [soil metagenome]
MGIVIVISALLLRRGVLFVCIAALAGVAPVAAQRPAGQDSGWDLPRSLELMDLARARRLLPQQDTLLRNYSARAEGFVYFYLDRRETEERTLIKVDQVALEVFWAPPNRTKQRIVGLRDESRLPNRMHYHLDHLTVVQDGFGDVIRMGDGDEVGDVPHPAAPGSDSIYQFRLTDSLTLRLPTATEPIRVYEIQVRPRRVDRSALIGSVFVDRASGDIVRMTFTFTPASYVDRRLDYINVSLDNGLWEGRYWLPHEQTLQIRRQVPELDFVAGAVIHGRMRISEYVFNDSLPETTFYGYPVTAVSPAERREFDFDRGIFDDLNEAGLAPPADLAQIRQQAAAMLGTSRLSGLPRWRLNVASASSVFRYNRAEGVTLGAGISYVPGPPLRGDLTVGYAFGPDRPWGAATLRSRLLRDGDVSFRLGYRQPRDVGVAPAWPTAINSLAAILFGEDLLDPYFASGAGVTLRHGLSGRLDGTVALAGERHRSATLTQRTPPFSGSTFFRDIRQIDEGDIASITLGLSRTVADPRASDWDGSVRLESGIFSGASYIRPAAGIRVREVSADHSRSLLLSASGGFVTNGAPSQHLFVMGGQNTLPGYNHRGFSGTRYALFQAEATAAMLRPWLALRLLAAAGATGGIPTAHHGIPPGATPAQPVTPVQPSWICIDQCAWSSWPAGSSEGVRFSAGAGVSLLWDLLRVDAVRGLNGGRWRLLLSFHPEFWDMS